MEKYKVTSETIEIGSHVLHRVKALRSFSDVKEGDLGGFIESEYNLSHSNNCWVYKEGRVFGNARVCEDALVFENAQVFGNARVCEDALVCEDARVFGNALVDGNARIYGEAYLTGYISVSGNARVCGTAKIGGNTRVDSSIWNKTIQIKNTCYIISTTLKKLKCYY